MELAYFWPQVRELTLASLKSRYRKTLAGFIWVVINPLLMFGVQGLVFKKFLNINIDNYYLFLAGGLLPWTFFVQTVQMGTPVYVTQSQILRSFKINPMVILSAQVLDNFINFIASFVLILFPLYVTSGNDVTVLALLPLALLPLLVGTLAITVTLSTLNVFFRDTNFIIGFAFSVLFFLTPIFYPKTFVPVEWQWLVHFNPVVYFIEPFRSVIYDSSNFWMAWGQGLLVSGLFVLIALFVWRKNRNDFYRKL